MTIPAYSLRPAHADECLQILAWRNAPEVRKSMLTKDVIDEATHRDWWARKQSDPAFRLLITECDSVPIAVQAFFDISGSEAWWAFYFTSHMPTDLGEMMERWRHVEAAGIGYGFHILGVARLLCEVLRSNAGVLRWHRRFGFEPLPRSVSASPPHHDLEVLGMTEETYRALYARPDLKRWDMIAVTPHPFDDPKEGPPA